MPRSTSRRSQLLIGALAVLLALPLVAWQQVAQADPGGAVPTETLVTGPVSATVGVPTSLTVSVSPADAAGTVLFFVVDAGGNPTSAGAPVEVEDGMADLDYTFTDSGEVEVRAVFSPSDDEAYVWSQDGLDLTVAEGPGLETTTVLTGPASATVGVPVDLLATVEPDFLSGSVAFWVDDEIVGDPVPVEEGRATWTHAFDEAGPVEVLAVFTPLDVQYDQSDDVHELVVSPSGPQPSSTATSLDAPAEAKVGEAVTLTATATPAVDGTFRFFADGRALGSVPAAGGSATLTHTFTAAASAQVTATFTPTDPAFASSGAGRTVVVTRTETTVRVAGPAGAAVGEPTTFTASVAPADVPGSVSFTVGGEPAGGPVPVEAGAASLSHTFTSTGTATVRATFTPSDPATYDGASDATGVDVTIALPATTVEVTGPVDATAGTPATITAAVQPSDVTGTVTFVVEGTEKTVEVDAGTATTTHTFTASGPASVIATFQPTEGSGYQAAVSPARVVEVAAGPSATSPETPIGTTEVTVEDDGSDTCVPRGAAVARANPSIAPIQFFITTIVQSIGSFVFNALQFISNSIQWLSGQIAAIFRVGPYSCGSGRAHRAEDVTVHRAQCVAIESGIQCPVDLPPGSAISVAMPVPLPADAAGRRLTMTPELSMVDPVTGEVRVLASDTVTVQVPRRTVLTARLGPVRRGVDSVRRGEAVAYRVAVTNAGVVAADDVRACIRLGRGVEVRRAPGATVRGQRVCWTLPSLRKGTSTARTLTVVAPQAKRDLTLRAVVTPRKRQADVVRLRTALPVR